MNEYQIGVIYFSGLLIALIISILVLLYLRPIQKPIKKISEKFEILWSKSFKTTVILAGLLGALSVSFKDCKGNYDYLLESKTKTVMKGVEQVSSAFGYLTVFIIVWFVIFITLFMMLKFKKNKSNF